MKTVLRVSTVRRNIGSTHRGMSWHTRGRYCTGEHIPLALLAYTNTSDCAEAVQVRKVGAPLKYNRSVMSRSQTPQKTRRPCQGVPTHVVASSHRMSGQRHTMSWSHSTSVPFLTKLRM